METVWVGGGGRALYTFLWAVALKACLEKMVNATVGFSFCSPLRTLTGLRPEVLAGAG